MNPFKIISNIPKEIAKALILVYQKLFSFDHAFWANPAKFRVCIYHPSCSEYTYQAIDKFGVVRGSLMGGARIVRCNPLSKPGLDLVPDHFSMKRNEE